MRPMLWIRNMDTGSRFEPSKKLVRWTWIGVGFLTGAFLITACVLLFVPPPRRPGATDPALITQVHFEEVICLGCGSLQRAISTKEGNGPWLNWPRHCTECGHSLPAGKWIGSQPHPAQTSPVPRFPK